MARGDNKSDRQPGSNQPSTEVQQPPGSGQSGSDRPQVSPPLNVDKGVAPQVESQTPEGAGAPERKSRASNFSPIFRCNSVAKASGANPEEVRLVRHNAEDPNVEVRIINLDAEAQDFFKVGSLYSVTIDEEGAAEEQE